MFDFEEALRLVAKQSVLCVGDVMLDDFVYGEVTRISPEAPTPVLGVKHSAIEIGGAGNVARNIASLGANCIFVGLVGDDEAGRTLRTTVASTKGRPARLSSAARSSRTIGATGRNCSRPLTSLRRSRFAALRASLTATVALPRIAAAIADE